MILVTVIIIRRAGKLVVSMHLYNHLTRIFRLICMFRFFIYIKSVLFIIFKIPVGGAIIGVFKQSDMTTIAKFYPGRASSVPSRDLVLTLLNHGRKGLLETFNIQKRVVVSTTKATMIEGCSFVNFGSHSSEQHGGYLNIACGVGMSEAEVDDLFNRLKTTYERFCRQNRINVNEEVNFLYDSAND
ncbi:putative O-phosphoseryl-tRNA(Sec) selenium transferase [Dictyocaulus viviparus]|uniref:O-phosphoseryl-tRNA(Sec) selenium transferase n=1 Tax=Dictyocaulus viviparus TaxID=29172 RepID=A0A0D8XQK0_DICVI|nr:putative O-phosphoseryl-tRNA(Sec) selenium transferase [Dictyocaulus viviparus]